MRRSYPIRVFVNGRLYKRAYIDDHFEKKHSKDVNDFIILGLVKALDGNRFVPEAVSKDGYQYFKLDPWYFGGKPYRLVWMLPPKGEAFIGVINVFRRRYGK